MTESYLIKDKCWSTVNFRKFISITIDLMGNCKTFQRGFFEKIINAIHLKTIFF